MKSRLFTRWIVLVAVASCWRVALAEDDSEATGAVADSVADSAALYDLAYKFKVGETLRWEVIHKATVRTSIQGTTETANAHARA